MRKVRQLGTGLNTKKKWFISLMILPAVLFPLVFTYYPMIRGSMMAFMDYNLMNINNIRFVGLDNFKTLFSSSPMNNFDQVLINTIKWVGISLLFQLVIGFGLALLLKNKFRGASVYQGLIFFPWAVSGFIIGIMWRWMFNGTSGVINDLLMKLHLIQEPVGWLASKDTALLSCIIANIWYGIPFFTIMITAALRGVAKELYESAEVDGANGFQKFAFITVPSIRSVLVVTVLLRVIWIFNFPELIYSMTQGGPAGSSNIVTSYMMQLVYSLDYGMASAVGVLVMLFLTIFAIIYLAITNYSVRGEVK